VGLVAQKVQEDLAVLVVQMGQLFLVDLANLVILEGPVDLEGLVVQVDLVDLEDPMDPVLQKDLETQVVSFNKQGFNGLVSTW
jgi:hypothetical protein